MEKYLINPNQKIGKISKNIYGHFSEHLGRCIYDGLYVGEDSPIPNVKGIRCDIVNALKDIKIPVLRWPGGCFADEYHWKDGIGPKETRKKMVNTHWGGFVEDNSFGTHEFFELCRQLDCDAYINGNVGSGTVQEMNEWVEYITFDGISPMAELRLENGQEKPWKMKFFGIGNENWCCGGHMQAEYYADEYLRYATYVRNYDANKPISKIACGPHNDDYHWTEVMMKKAAPFMDGLALHYYTYCGTRESKATHHATGFTKEEYYKVVEQAYRMEELVATHSGIMHRYDPEGKVALIVDEWGTWFAVEPGTNPRFLYQQNTMRDAIVAGLTLNIFNKHCDRVKMANIAQVVNVLQAMILTDGEKMLLTPTYHIFKMYADHHENTLLGSYITSKKSVEGGNAPQLIESDSMHENGTITSTIVNTSSDQSAEILCQIADFRVSQITAEILSNKMDAYNTFEDQNAVHICTFSDFESTADGFKTVIPPCSVVKFTVK